MWNNSGCGQNNCSCCNPTPGCCCGKCCQKEEKKEFVCHCEEKKQEGCNNNFGCCQNQNNFGYYNY